MAISKPESRKKTRTTLSPKPLSLPRTLTVRSHQLFHWPVFFGSCVGSEVNTGGKECNLCSRTPGLKDIMETVWRGNTIDGADARTCINAESTVYTLSCSDPYHSFLLGSIAVH